MILVSLVDLFEPFQLTVPVTPPPPPPPPSTGAAFFVLYDPADPDHKRVQVKVTPRP